MRVLIATTELQGARPDDFSSAVDGELLTPVAVACAAPGCGCQRGFPGLGSGFATTTAMIVERPFITRDQLRDAVAGWLERCGWGDLLGHDHADEFDEIVDEHVDAIDEVCAALPLGTVVERHGDHVSARPHRAAA